MFDIKRELEQEEHSGNPIAQHPITALSFHKLRKIFMDDI
jgi:hypothetical protein